jgi:hypothetical protein
MTIEQQSDRNMTSSGRMAPRVSDMIDLQQALVADHIAGLQREGAILRAERSSTESAHAVEPAMTEPVPLPVVRSGSPRVRMGRFLVAIGTAIAGTTEPMARVLEDCAGDSGDTLSPAA